MKISISKILLWVIIYSVAMAFMESAVVVYIRELYYPDGFSFPLRLIQSHIAVTELIREAATLIMLIAIAVLAGKNAIERFAYFIFSFAIWDIFYYVFLKLILGWPVSIFEWDVLFLLPFTWVGPVIAPVINSLLMIILALIIIVTGRNKIVKSPILVWAFLIIGSLVVIASYTEEYIDYMSTRFSVVELLNPKNTEDIFEFATSFIPESFNWFVFSIGTLLHIAGIIYLYIRNK